MCCAARRFPRRSGAGAARSTQSGQLPDCPVMRVALEQRGAAVIEIAAGPILIGDGPPRDTTVLFWAAALRIRVIQAR